MYPKNQDHYENSGQHGFTPFKNSRKAYQNNSGSKSRKEDYTKRSGAKHKQYSPVEGPNKGQLQYFTSGWMLDENVLLSVTAVTTTKSKLSDKGWFGSIACSITNTKSGVKAFHWGTMEEKTGKVYITDMNLCLSPRANNGGYCGKLFAKNYSK
jgi:hypothetical protein